MASNPAKRETTRATDAYALKAIMPRLGDAAVGAITAREIQALVVEWSSRLSARTVRRQYDVLRAVFNFAVDRDYLTRSPCRSIKLPEVHPLRRCVLTATDLARLADEIDESCRPMVYLGAVLGLRWGEAAGLRAGSVDLQSATVRIEEQFTRGARGASVSGPPKSHAGRRTLAMPPTLTAMLARHLMSRGASEPYAFLFVDIRGEPLRYDSWRRGIWNPACRRAALSGVTFHDLRRTNATALVTGGVDLKTAQVRLGHTDPRLTIGLYAQATTSADRNAAEALEHHFFGTTEPTSTNQSPSLR
jgi:integrase